MDFNMDIFFFQANLATDGNILSFDPWDGTWFGRNKLPFVQDGTPNYI